MLASAAMVRNNSLALALVILTLGLPMSAAAANGDWPHWRGPLGTGVSPDGDPPARFSPTENVKWKWQDPGLAFSSPIVWGDRVFVTTVVPNPAGAASAEPEQKGIFGLEHPTVPQRFTVVALDRETGRELWSRVAREVVPHEGYHKTLSSYANMSPTTDGERLYVSFGSRGLYAYDFSGELLWSRDFEVAMHIFNRFGESSSPALHGDTLVLSFDHDGPQSSFVVAVDKRNGEIKWRRDRDEKTDWSSPIIVEHQGKSQVVLSGGNFARAYDLESGEELWKVSGLTKGPVPAPVPGPGMVYLASGTNGQAFKAMRLGGSGDLTGTDFEAWTLAKSVSYNPTPLLWGDELYMLKDVMSGNTFVSAFDAGTGTPRYQDGRLPQAWTIKASPVGAAGRIYLASEEGDVIVLARGAALEVLGVSSMDEQILATPAIAGRDLFLRTRAHLWRLAEAPPAAAE